MYLLSLLLDRLVPVQGVQFRSLHRLHQRACCLRNIDGMNCSAQCQILCGRSYFHSTLKGKKAPVTAAMATGGAEATLFGGAVLGYFLRHDGDSSIDCNDGHHCV